MKRDRAFIANFLDGESSGRLVEINERAPPFVCNRGKRSIQGLAAIATGNSTIEVLWALNTSTGTEKPYTYQGQKYIAHTPTGNFGIIRVVDGYDNGPLGQLYRPRYFTSAGHAIRWRIAISPIAALGRV